MKKYKPERMTAVKVGQAVRSLLELGEARISIERIEKDRFVVTTHEPAKK